MKPKIGKYYFVISVVFLVFVYGVFVGRTKMFPFKLFEQAKDGFDYVVERLKKRAAIIENKDNKFLNAPVYIGDTLKRYVLISGIDSSGSVYVKLINESNRTIKKWDIDINYFADLLKDGQDWKGEFSLKKQLIHGISILDNGDLVFNIEKSGMIRLNRESEVVWSLPIKSHHSIYIDNDGFIWACGLHYTGLEYPSSTNRMLDQSILKISQEGKIVNYWSLTKILEDSGLSGMAFPLGSERVFNRYHINDVEPFEGNDSGFFEKGDIMVSIRDFNTIMIFNAQTGLVKKLVSFHFSRQHDPDFIDANTISVFDNRYFDTKGGNMSSRIVEINVVKNELDVFFIGSSEFPFYSRTMGKHTWLPNGHLLATDAESGKVFEIDENKKVVWVYNNFIGKNRKGMVFDAIPVSDEIVEIYKNDK
ncbi:hypothetical protein GC194_05420 [bacterium]|nr:hypothetical protein [bacterium]